MNAPKLSVIVPVYNVEQYLPECIDSILAQTFTDFELLLVNDGSTDNSGKICDEYAGKDKRIRVFHKENEGVSSARNVGINAAAGDWLGFVDSDDTIDAKMYETLLDNAYKYKAEISHCGYLKFGNGKIIQKYGTNELIICSNVDGLQKFILGNKIEPSLCTKIFKKELFVSIRINENLQVNEDFLANYYLFKKAEKTVFDDKCLYHYRTRIDSCTQSSFSEKLFQLLTVSDIIIKDNDDNMLIRSFCVHKKVSSYFSIINRIIKTCKFYDKYNLLRKELLSYKKDILFDKNRIYNTKQKVAIILLWLTPCLYKKLV